MPLWERFLCSPSYIQQKSLGNMLLSPLLLFACSILTNVKPVPFLDGPIEEIALQRSRREESIFVYYREETALSDDDLTKGVSDIYAFLSD